MIMKTTHLGYMVQTGYNASPRHCCIFGFAKSYTRKLDENTKVEHDVEIVEATSLTWKLAKAYLLDYIMTI